MELPAYLRQDELDAFMNLASQSNLESFLPQSNDDSMKVDGNPYAARRSIPYVALIMGDEAERERRIAFAWRDLYHYMIEQIAFYWVGKEDYHFFRLIPQVRRAYTSHHLELILTAEIFVAQTRDAIFPGEIIYQDQEDGTQKLYEWKCGYCQGVNPFPERKCENCGSNRAVLIQEVRGY